MVQSPRGHVIFQDVYQINRCLVSRLYPSRDAERETIIPRKGLVSNPFFLRRLRRKADESHNQLELILNVLGTPTIDEFYAITSRRSKEYIRSLAFRKKIPFRELYPKASKEAIDFLDHTLTCMSLLLLFPAVYSSSSNIWIPDFPLSILVIRRPFPLQLLLPIPPRCRSSPHPTPAGVRANQQSTHERGSQ